MEFVNKIYTKGKKHISYPFRAYFLDTDEGESPKVIISVPKKLHKRAVARNYIRRRIRESVRLSKAEFPAIQGKHILIVYISSKKQEYAYINEHIRILFSKIS